MDNTGHFFVTKQSIEIINHDYFNKESIKKDLLTFCTQPDKDETEGSFKWHFYNPATRKNFKGERITALSKFIEHYKNSVMNKDIKELGRAIHFLEDLCTPVHVYYEDTLDAVYRFTQHVNFEKMIDKATKKFDLSTIPQIDQDYYLLNSLKTIGKACAMESSIYFDKLDKYPKSSELTANITLSRGIVAVKGILSRYLKESETSV